MSHAHTPDHPPHTVEDLDRDIEAVERHIETDEDKFLKPSPDGIGPTLGVDLKTPRP